MGETEFVEGQLKIPARCMRELYNGVEFPPKKSGLSPTGKSEADFGKFWCAHFSRAMVVSEPKTPMLNSLHFSRRVNVVKLLRSRQFIANGFQSSSEEEQFFWGWGAEGVKS